jgi:peptidoglycan/LPS O-acetylase OafA/YrhL
MTDSHAPVRRSRFACLLLVSLTLWVVLSPQPSKSSSNSTQLLLSASVAVIHVAFLSAWLVHGNLPAVLAGMLVMISGTTRLALDNDLQRHWILGETCFVVVVGLLLLIWSELGRRRTSPLLWLLAAVGGMAALVPVLVQSAQIAELLNGVAAPEMKSSLARLHHAIVGMFIVGVLLGVWQAYRRRTCPRPALAAAGAIGLLVPVAAYGIANIVAPIRFEPFLSGADWTRFVSDFTAWVKDDGYQNAVDQPWAWAPPWPLLLLTVIGFWRAIARGFRQRGQGEMPVAWVIALGLGIALLVISPIHPFSDRSLSLILATSLLPVFGIVDLIYLLWEGIVLKAPEDDIPAVIFNRERRDGTPP